MSLFAWYITPVSSVHKVHLQGMQFHNWFMYNRFSRAWVTPMSVCTGKYC